MGTQTNDETEWENKRWVVSSRMLIRGRKLATNIFTADIFIFISFLNSSAKSQVGMLTHQSHINQFGKLGVADSHHFWSVV